MVLWGLAGCQCCQLTESYMDVVDCVADRSPHADALYCAGLDLTRIGYPDWCQYKINRCLYGECCCRGCRPIPGYVHNPIYIQPWDAPTPKPIPQAPEIPPGMYPGPDSIEAPPMDQLKPIQDPLQLEKGDAMPSEPPLPPTLPVPPAPTPAAPLPMPNFNL